MMQTTAMNPSPYIEQPESEGILVVKAGPGLRARFVRAVEASDWDEELMRQEKWMNGVCLAVIGLSVLFLVPILLAQLLK